MIIRGKEFDVAEESMKVCKMLAQRQPVKFGKEQFTLQKCKASETLPVNLPGEPIALLSQQLHH